MGADFSMTKEACDEAFKVFDGNGDGTVSLPELEEKLSHNVKILKGTVPFLFFLLDSNGNGKIDKKEFTLFYEQLQKMGFKGDLYDLVTCAVDKNGDNKIDKKELERCLKFKNLDIDKFDAKLCKDVLTRDEFIMILRIHLK